MSGRHTRKRRKGKGLEEVGPFTKDMALHRGVSHDRRLQRAYAMKVQGLSLTEIGLRLHADPSMNRDGVGFDGGYGWQNYRLGKPPLSGKALAVSVCRDLRGELKGARLASEISRQEALMLHVDRLEAAAAAAWPAVMEGNARQHEVWLQNMGQQAAVLGLNAPEQHEVTGHIVVEGVQPDYTPEFVADVFAALVEVGAITEGTAIPAILAPPAADNDITDAEVVDVPPG